MVTQHDSNRALGIPVAPEREAPPALLAAVVDDDVVAGTLRRANARALATCQICGAPACRPPDLVKPAVFCGRHMAVEWLLALATDTTSVAPPLQLFQRAAQKPPPATLRLPGEILKVWLDHDPSPSRAAVRDALASADTVVTLDQFDTPAFRDWIAKLRPRLETVRRNNRRGLCAQPGIEEGRR